MQGDALSLSSALPLFWLPLFPLVRASFLPFGAPLPLIRHQRTARSGHPNRRMLRFQAPYARFYAWRGSARRFRLKKLCLFWLATYLYWAMSGGLARNFLFS